MADSNSSMAGQIVGNLLWPHASRLRRAKGAVRSGCMFAFVDF